jgi:hypothetical protein
MNNFRFGLRKQGLGLRLGVRRYCLGLMLGGVIFPKGNHDYMLFIVKTAMVIHVFFSFFLSFLCFCWCLVVNVFLLVGDHRVVVYVLCSLCFCCHMVLCCSCLMLIMLLLLSKFIVLLLLPNIHHVLVATSHSLSCCQSTSIVMLMLPCIHHVVVIT